MRNDGRTARPSRWFLPDSGLGGGIWQSGESASRRHPRAEPRHRALARTATVVASSAKAEQSRRNAPYERALFRCFGRGFGPGFAIRQHTQRTLVDVEQRFLLVHVVLVHAPDADDLAHDGAVEAAALGFGVDILDIGAQRALLLLEPLDAFDERAQLLAGNPPDIRHSFPLPCCSDKVSGGRPSVSASAGTPRTPPSVPASPLSDASCATRRMACHRQSRAPRDRTARPHAHRPPRGTI